MKYDPNTNQRRSIRLKGYDYSQQGAYFVTICAHNRAILFGRIKKGKINLNAAGKMVYSWWNKLQQKYANVELDEFIVMPNHFHGIIFVGADPCVCPYIQTNIPAIQTNIPAIQTENHRDTQVINPGEHMGSCENNPGEHMGSCKINPGEHMGSCKINPGTHMGSCENNPGEHMGSPLRKPVALSGIIQWFKSMTTNEYIRNVKNHDWPPFNKRLWQRNYYEHIIRHGYELNRIRNYIIENPSKWKIDIPSTH